MGRADEIDETLGYLSTAVRRIQLTEQFPKDINLPQYETVQCSALMLAAGVVDYLAIAIEHLSRPLSGALIPEFC
jgi:hypothetical protein